MWVMLGAESARALDAPKLKWSSASMATGLLFCWILMARVASSRCWRQRLLERRCGPELSRSDQGRAADEATPLVPTPPLRSGKTTATGPQDLHGAADDERSERTHSVPSVASRRVAAPYGVDDLALKRSISSKKVLNFKARYARQEAF